MAWHPSRQPAGRQLAGEPIRITTANAGRGEDISARQRRYVLAMGFRTVCFVAAIFVTITWVRVVLIVGAVVLPYVAVVMANAGASKSDGFALLGDASGTRELPPSGGSGDDSGPVHL